jgi:diguanylate cyclase (GGDEF)-like protein/PAS domain S-box-containing protein
MKKVAVGITLTLCGGALLIRMGVMGAVFSTNYLPHRFCYLAQPGLIWTNVLSDGSIAVSYLVIFGCLLRVSGKLRSIPDSRPYLVILFAFAAFIAACSATHVLDVVTVWLPVYPLSAAFKLICTAVSVPTAVFMIRITPKIAENLQSYLEGLKAAKREQEDVTANYRGQIEAADRSMMIVEFDLDGCVLRTNENCLLAFGYTPAEVVGKHHSLFVSAELRESPAYEEFWCRLRNGDYQRGLYSRRHKDGREIWLEATYNPVFDASRRPAKFVKFATDVTERVLAQKKLVETESRLKAIVDHVLAGIIMVDSGGKIASINPAAVAMFGYTAEELIGENVGTLMPEADQTARDGDLALYPSTQDAGSTGFGRELEGVTRQGTRFPIDLTVTETSHGGQRMFIWLVRDITHRKQLDAERSLHEKLLRKSEQLLEQTNRLAGVGGWELDLDTSEVFWAAETHRILGADRSYRPNLAQALEMYAPESRSRVVEAIERSRQTGASWDIEAELTGFDGRRIWARIVGSVEWWAGRPARIVGAIQDITLRVAERLALEEATTRASLATESGGIGIWDCNLATRMVTADALKCRLVGIKPETTRVDPIEFWREFVHLEDRERVDRELSESLTSAKPYSVEYRVWHRDGTIRFIESHGQVIFDESGKAVRMVGTNVDITPRKVAEESTRQAQQEAEIANRAKSDFLANMSHEIRTPMNAIIGMTHLAQRAHPSPQQQGYLNKIGTAAQSLLAIMNDILDFSKIEAGKLELERIAFPLNDVWRNLIDIVDEKAKAKGLRITFQVSPDTPQFLIGDPLRLGQILINLVNNAIKFTERGDILVSVASEPLEHDQVRLTFSVRDTGIGMTPQQVAGLFQSFNQGDTSYTRRYGGTGLGLAISRQLCALMGGTIRVESELGKGSTFVFEIVSTAGTLELVKPDFETSIALAESVLIVDDSEDARHSLRTMLESGGFITRAVSSGEEALLVLLDALQKTKPFDVVLMDWRLPGVDGLQAAQRIRSQLPAPQQPAILIISAFKRDEVFSGSGSTQTDGFLLKPIDQGVLIESVRKSISERRKTVPCGQPETDPGTTQLAGKRVLLVEDNEINRELAGELLGDLGVVVSYAVDGQEGVRRVLEQTFDLVLMDIQMPLLDGLSATRQIRATGKCPTLPIIAMTAHAMTGDRARSLEAGMNDHLTKPITPSGLTEMLLRWLPVKPQQTQQASTSAGDPGPQDRVPASLPPFNIQAALARTNNKPKLLHKMLATFYQQYAGAADLLREQLATGAHEDAHRLAHSLKGLAATLEASEWAQSAAEVETAFRAGQTSAIGPLIEQLERTLAPAIAAAGSLVHSQVQPASKAAARTAARHSVLLVVDDVSTEFQLLSGILGDEYQMEHVRDGIAAINRAAQNPPDVILLDVMMPGLDGYEVCTRLKAMEATRHIPVIFITGANDPASETKGLEVGGADYIIKPFNPAVVRARVHHQLELREKQAKLSSLAATDALTGLSNRRHFHEVFAHECARHARSGKQLGLILLDVDFFKLFNDSYGHVAGDECLRRIASALQGVLVRATDVIARYGGEEFILMLPETDLEGTVVVAERIQSAIRDMAIAHSHSSVANHVTVSLGALSARCCPAARAHGLLALVDRQLYAAKRAGRNCVSAANYRYNESSCEYVIEEQVGRERLHLFEVAR